MGLFDRILRKSRTAKRTAVKKKKPASETKVKQHPTAQGIEPDNQKIDDWEAMMAKVRAHPLSQAGIINTEILSRLLQSIENIDYKLSDLKKLDEIIALLNQSKTELKQKGVESTSLDAAVSELERISFGDKTTMEAIKKFGPITTEKLADKMKLSRSTMSTKLNKLYTIGILDKKIVGKEVQFYSKIND